MEPKTISVRTFVSRRIPGPPIESRHLALSPNDQVNLHANTFRPRMVREHYPRLIRQWYRPVIEELIVERHRCGYTQADIESMIGCAGSLVAKWEVGLKLPSLYHLLLWCEALGMELQPEKVDI